MVNTYVLVNPYIEGSFEKSVKARNSIEAGKMLYTGLSEHFNNNVPKFLFTIQKGTSGKGKYYSFKVKENKSENEINFSIEPYTIKNESSSYKGLQEKIKSFKEKLASQEGGAKKVKKTKKKPAKKAASKTVRKTKKEVEENIFDDDSDSVSDSDLDLDDSPKHNKTRVQRYVPTNNFPIYNWWYDPYLYRMNSVYVPTFYSYVTPYIQISLR